MGLSTEQQALVEQRLNNDKKSTLIAYLLWFFVGAFGAHRFYLGQTGSGIAMLALLIVGGLTLGFAVGIVFLVILAVWLFVDLFLIPGMVDQDTKAKRMQISNELSAMSGSR